jgi:GDP-L-fucose synthase
MTNQKVLDSFKNKNIMVTGGTGLIGRQVVDILSKITCNIRVVSLDKISLNSNIDYIYGDLSEFSFCKEMAKNMDYVFHIAGIGGSVQAAKDKIASHFVPMLMMNMNILEACRINKVEKVVYTSSVGAYAAAEVFKESNYRLDSIPMDFAGWAKRMAEEQIRAYQIEYGINNFAIVRPSNVYGPGDNFDPTNSLVIPSLMYRIYKGENPLAVWGDGSAIRDFVYSKDVAEGIILALYYGTDSKCMNIGFGNEISIRDLVETLKEFLDFEYVFDSSKTTGAAKRIMDISLARKKIGYKPVTTLREGLEKTWNWFIKHPKDHEFKKNYFKLGN